MLREGRRRALGAEGGGSPGRAHSSSMARILFYFQPGSQRAPLSLRQAAPVEPRAETARHVSPQEVATLTHSPGLDSCLRGPAESWRLQRATGPSVGPCPPRLASEPTALSSLGGADAEANAAVTRPRSCSGSGAWSALNLGGHLTSSWHSDCSVSRKIIGRPREMLGYSNLGSRFPSVGKSRNPSLPQFPHL